MKLKLNGILREFETSAWVPIRYFARYRKSYLKDARDGDRQEKLLRLCHVSMKDEMSFSAFRKEVEADGNFLPFAELLAFAVFESHEEKTKGERPDYGLDYNEFTFLAIFGKSGLPAQLLDELCYFDICEILNLQGILENPETYKHRFAGAEERKALLGITEEREKKIEEYLKNIEFAIDK